MTPVELFLVLVVWTWLRFYAGRWRYELSISYEWTFHYGYPRGLRKYAIAALRALRP